MTPEGAYLISLGQALATMGLYPAGHPARERAIEASFEHLLNALDGVPSIKFSFLGTEAIVGHRPMTELPGWEWATKLSSAGIERIEVDAGVTRDGYLRFTDELWSQLGGTRYSSAESRQLVRQLARFGTLRLERPAQPQEKPHEAAILDDEPGSPESLAEEIEAIDWMQREAVRVGSVPLAEAEAVVGSLSATMHTEQRLLLPLLNIKEFDQYTLTHSCNVAVLAIGLAERIGLDAAAVRAMGVSGLLHDIGKIRIPHDVLVKPGRYTDEERAIMCRHPVDGAEIILGQQGSTDVAAVVAYEHHLYIDGRGYPPLRFARGSHFAGRIVHICDIYDALCTHRPYRDAWNPPEALAYVEQQAGSELDPGLVTAFVGMIREATVTRMPLSPSGPSEGAPTPGS